MQTVYGHSRQVLNEFINCYQSSLKGTQELKEQKNLQKTNGRAVSLHPCLVPARTRAGGIEQDLLKEAVLESRNEEWVPQDCVDCHITPRWTFQWHLAGNFWVLGDQHRNLPSPEFIKFIPTSSSFLDRGLKRAESASGSLWYPNAQ